MKELSLNILDIVQNSITAGAEHIGIALLEDADGKLRMTVCDDGCGMTKAEQKKIFEPFYSSKNSNTSWGMGLYHVRTIIRAHVGSLRVESRPGTAR